MNQIPPPGVNLFLFQPSSSGGAKLLASTNQAELHASRVELVENLGVRMLALPVESQSQFCALLMPDARTCLAVRGVKHGLLAVWDLSFPIPPAGVRYRIASKTRFKDIPDPFFWMDSFPVTGDERGDLPAIPFPAMPERRNAEVLRVQFKTGDGAFLMGGAQALVDSCKVRIQREKPDLEAVRTLWNFLPDSTRRTLGFSTWTNDEHLVDGISIVPTTAPAVVPGYLTEDQCRDYPESSYEKQLQYAIDYSDQKLLDKLMRRRSSKETLSLAIWMVGIAFVVLVVMKVLFPPR